MLCAPENMKRKNDGRINLPQGKNQWKSTNTIILTGKED